MSERRGDSPLYPVERSFVIQLTRDAGPADLFAGKIEHLASGEAFCFSTLAELNELIRNMTAAPFGAPSPQSPQSTQSRRES